MQIFNIEMKARVKSHKMPDGDNVVFWRWITPNTIAIVTPTSVYHWSMDGGEEPTKQFDRHASITGGQIINYQASADGKWYVLVGISQGAGGTIVGNMQLYSVEKKISQPLKGHAGCFTNIKVDGIDRSVFCFVEMKPNEAGGMSNPRVRALFFLSPSCFLIYSCTTAVCDGAWEGEGRARWPVQVGSPGHSLR